MGMVAVLRTRWRPEVTLVLLLLALTASFGACTFARTTHNPSVRALDPSFIQIGRTTRLQVLEGLGPPSVPTDREIARPGPSPRFFRYYTVETKETGFYIAYFLSLPFEWSDRMPVYDLLVEFDERGVVSDVHVANRDTIWRPLSGEGSRAPEQVTRLGTGGQKP